MFHWLFPERCTRCGVSYKKAVVNCETQHIVVVSGPGRERDPHIWPRSEPKWPAMTDEEYAELENNISLMMMD